MAVKIYPEHRYLTYLLVLGLLLLSAMHRAQGQTLPSDVDKNLTTLAVEADKKMFSSPKEALEIAEKIAQLSALAKDERKRLEIAVTAKSITGEALLRMGNPAKARPAIESAIQAVKPRRDLMHLKGKLLITLGAIEVELANADKALAAFQQAYEAFRVIGRKRDQATALQSMGWLYRNARDFKRSERYYRQSIDTYVDGGTIEVSGRNNLGNVLRQMERFEQAEDEYRRAFVIAEKQSNRPVMSLILRNLARNSLESGAIANARETLDEELKLSGVRDRNTVALLAQAALMQGQVSDADRLIGEAFAGSDLESTNLSMLEAHELAHDIYSRTGKTALALKHLEAAKRLTEESMSVAASTSSALMAARFDYQNQELRISQLKATELKRSIEFERARARLQRWIFAITGVGVAIIIGILGFAVVTLRRSRNEVRAANQGLERSNIALEKALAAKTEFLATTSHEIRTPLNGILGMTQVMLADVRLSAQMRDRIGVVHGAGVTMRALVDDILDVAKMETGNLTVEQVPVDVADVLLDVSRMWREQAAAKGLGFDLEVADDLGWIESDPARLRQIVFNLLSNAIKFTDNGAVALIARRAAAAGEAKPHLEILVRDTGIGIPAEKQHLIFESFRQADAGTTRRFGGTGLGLAICRNLADALGGTIAVESGEGRGSTFRVLLPMVPVEQPGQIGTSTAVMLVLERNPIARSTLKTLLEPHAGEVMFATSVEDACARIVDHRIRLVLADQATLAAEADFALALETLAACARDNCAKSAILWSAPSEEDERRAQAAGVDIFLAKPIAARALVSALFGDSQPAGGVTPLVPQAA